MPERHLINESCVYAVEGGVLPPPRTPQPITHARALSAHAVHQLCSRERRALRVEGGGGGGEGHGGWVGNVRPSLGRSDFSCREVASRCLSSGSFALDVSSGQVTEVGRGSAEQLLGVSVPRASGLSVRAGPAFLRTPPMGAGEVPQPPGGCSLPWTRLTCSARLPGDT